MSSREQVFVDLLDYFRHIGSNWAIYNCGDYFMDDKNESCYLYFGYGDGRERDQSLNSKISDYKQLSKYDEISFNDKYNHIHLHFGMKNTGYDRSLYKISDIGVATQKYGYLEPISKIYKPLHTCVMSGIYSSIIQNIFKDKMDIFIVNLTKDLYKISGYDNFDNYIKPVIPNATPSDHYVKNIFFNMISKNLIADKDFYNKLYSCNTYHQHKNNLNRKSPMRSRSFENKMYRSMNRPIKNTWTRHKYKHKHKDPYTSFGSILDLENDNANVNLENSTFRGKSFFKTQKMNNSIKRFRNSARLLIQNEKIKAEKAEAEKRVIEKKLAEMAEIIGIKQQTNKDIKAERKIAKIEKEKIKTEKAEIEKAKIENAKIAKAEKIKYEFEKAEREKAEREKAKKELAKQEAQNRANRDQNTALIRKQRRNEEVKDARRNFEQSTENYKKAIIDHEQYLTAVEEAEINLQVLENTPDKDFTDELDKVKQIELAKLQVEEANKKLEDYNAEFEKIKKQYKFDESKFLSF